MVRSVDPVIHFVDWFFLGEGGVEQLWELPDQFDILLTMGFQQFFWGFLLPWFLTRYSCRPSRSASQQSPPTPTKLYQLSTPKINPPKWPLSTGAEEEGEQEETGEEIEGEGEDKEIRGPELRHAHPVIHQIHPRSAVTAIINMLIKLGTVWHH